jgi:AcrR family transcriptional regulator
MADDPALRERVLDAIAYVVAETGARAVSLDEAAAHADLDPSEVRRVFPTLESLQAAVVDRLFETFYEDIATAAGTDDGPGAFAHACLAATRARFQHNDFPRVAAAVLPSLPLHPQVREATVVHRRAMRRSLEQDGMTAGHAALFSVAIDGLWLASMLELESLSPEERERVFDCLEGLLPPREAAPG